MTPKRRVDVLILLSTTIICGLLSVRSIVTETGVHTFGERLYVNQIKSLFFSGNDVYAVPNEYWPGKSRQEIGASYSAFNLNMILPEFTPAAFKPNEFRVVGWHNQITVLAEYGTHFIAPEAWLEYYEERGKLRKDAWILAPNHCQLFQGDFLGSSEFYYCKIKTGSIGLFCKSKDKFPSPSCTVQENITDNTTVVYHYSSDYVDQALDIDYKVRELLLSFKRTRA